jgi:hypothetical protein
MKSLVLALAMFVSSNVFAVTVELGKYHAVDKDTQSITADLELQAGGAATIKISASGTDVNCTGTYTVVGNELKSDVKCDNDAITTANVIIDISKVNPEGLRSASCVEVPVKIPDLLGDDSAIFILKKSDGKK